MDANTYYLNKHLSDIDESAQCHDRAQSIARMEMDDPQSKFYPWSPANISEAFNEAPLSALNRVTAAHGNDRELATVVREIVLGYWFETATDHFYKGD
jgi:hypothetical protein